MASDKMEDLSILVGLSQEEVEKWLKSRKKHLMLALEQANLLEDVDGEALVQWTENDLVQLDIPRLTALQILTARRTWARELQKQKLASQGIILSSSSLAPQGSNSTSNLNDVTEGSTGHDGPHFKRHCRRLEGGAPSETQDVVDYNSRAEVLDTADKSGELSSLPSAFSSREIIAVQEIGLQKREVVETFEGALNLGTQALDIGRGECTACRLPESNLGQSLPFVGCANRVAESSAEIEVTQQRAVAKAEGTTGLCGSQHESLAPSLHFHKSVQLGPRESRSEGDGYSMGCMDATYDRGAVQAGNIKVGVSSQAAQAECPPGTSASCSLHAIDVAQLVPAEALSEKAGHSLALREALDNMWALQDGGIRDVIASEAERNFAKRLELVHAMGRQQSFGNGNSPQQSQVLHNGRLDGRASPVGGTKSARNTGSERAVHCSRASFLPCELPKNSSPSALSSGAQGNLQRKDSVTQEIGAAQAASLTYPEGGVKIESLGSMHAVETRSCNDRSIKAEPSCSNVSGMKAEPVLHNVLDIRSEPLLSNVSGTRTETLLSHRLEAEIPGSVSPSVGQQGQVGCQPQIMSVENIQGKERVMVEGAEREGDETSVRRVEIAGPIGNAVSMKQSGQAGIRKNYVPRENVGRDGENRDTVISAIEPSSPHISTTPTVKLEGEAVNSEQIAIAEEVERNIGARALGGVPTPEPGSSALTTKPESIQKQGRESVRGGTSVIEPSSGTGTAPLDQQVGNCKQDGTADYRGKLRGGDTRTGARDSSNSSALAATPEPQAGSCKDNASIQYKQKLHGDSGRSMTPIEPRAGASEVPLQRQAAGCLQNVTDTQNLHRESLRSQTAAPGSAMDLAHGCTNNGEEQVMNVLDHVVQTDFQRLAGAERGQAGVARANGSGWTKEDELNTQRTHLSRVNGSAAGECAAHASRHEPVVGALSSLAAAVLPGPSVLEHVRQDRQTEGNIRPGDLPTSSQGAAAATRDKERETSGLACTSSHRANREEEMLCLLHRWSGMASSRDDQVVAALNEARQRIPDIQHLLAFLRRPRASHYPWRSLQALVSQAGSFLAFLDYLGLVKSPDLELTFQTLNKWLGRQKECADLMGQDLTLLKAAVKFCNAIVYTYHGKVDQAKPLLEEVLEVRKRLFGPEHSDVIEIHEFLAYCEPDPKKKLELYWQVLQAQRRVHSNDLMHRDILGAMHNFAYAHTELDQNARAIAEYRQVLDLRRKVLGDKHPETLCTAHALANALTDAGRPEDAEQLFREAEYFSRMILGASHADSRVYALSLAKHYLDVKKVTLARETLEWLLQPAVSVDHFNAEIDVEALHYLGECHYLTNKLTAALEVYRKVDELGRLMLTPEAEIVLLNNESLKKIHARLSTY